ncbi:MAG: hypothetical protein HYY00_05095 [Chloroflexi bacterium]|nr:hypothetical protein [Chloroflexota bacterium]
MKVRRLWWIAVAVWVVALGALLVVPALAAPSRQEGTPGSGAYGAMHAACVAGDVEGMTAAMGSLTEEDWQAMQGHMGGAGMGGMMAGQGMMGGSGMMGGQPGQGMMGGGGMMGGPSGQGMMGGGMMGGWSGRTMMAW